MNGHDDKVLDSYRSFLLITEISKDEPVSQRELASRLGISLGLVNSYLKNLVAKGYVRVTSFPRNRYAYLITPQGIAEKSRLAYQHLSYFTSLYTVARHDYLQLFRTLAGRGVTRLDFCGVDEVAEIAYLSLKETGLELGAVMDDEQAGGEFFGHAIVPLAAGNARDSRLVVVTSQKRADLLRRTLLALGVDGRSIFTLAH